MTDKAKIDPSLLGTKPFTADEADIVIPLNEDWKARQNERVVIDKIHKGNKPWIDPTVN